MYTLSKTTYAHHQKDENIEIAKPTDFESACTIADIIDIPIRDSIDGDTLMDPRQSNTIFIGRSSHDVHPQGINQSDLPASSDPAATRSWRRPQTERARAPNQNTTGEGQCSVPMLYAFPRPMSGSQVNQATTREDK